MKFRWSVAPAQPLLAEQLARELRLAPLLAQCLLNRGLSEPAAIRELYGDTRQGRQMLIARRLLERGVRVTGIDGWSWDAHRPDWAYDHQI